MVSSSMILGNMFWPWLPSYSRSTAETHILKDSGRSAQWTYQHRCPEHCEADPPAHTHASSHEAHGAHADELRCTSLSRARNDSNACFFNRIRNSMQRPSRRTQKHQSDLARNASGERLLNRVQICCRFRTAITALEPGTRVLYRS